MIDKFALLFSQAGILVLLWLVFTGKDLSKPEKQSKQKDDEA
jgi:hypothetical protein